MLQDADLGTLVGRGYTERPHPDGEGSIFRRDPLQFHVTGIWLVDGKSQVLYSRAQKRFFRTPVGTMPGSLPEEAERVALQDGYEILYPHLVEHEEWIAERFGPDYRIKLLTNLPADEKRYAKNWKLYFSECIRRQSARA